MTKILKLLTIFLIITGLLNCSQSNNSDTADTTKAGNNTNNNNSLLSKKNLQQKLTSWINPYKIDVQQGNILPSENLNKLKVGMDKKEVKYLLGTPMLSESSAKNKWLYIYTDASQGKINERHSLILSFSDEKLKDIKEESIVG